MEKVLDFSVKYRPGDIDDAAARAADAVAPVFEINGWTVESGPATAGRLAVALRQLLESATELESEGEVYGSRFVVKRYEEDDLRVYLDLGGVRPVDGET